MATEPNPEWTPEQVIRNWYETVWHGRDRDAILTLFDGEAKGLFRHDKDVLDPATFQQFWDLLDTTLDEIHVDFDEFVTEGNRVAFHYTFSAKHKATKKEISIEACAFATVHKGKIASAWNLLDTLTFTAEACGLPGDVFPQVLQGKKVAIAD